MPDERTYGFSLQDATALTNSIGSGEGWYPEIKPRGGGGGLLFGFEISADKLKTDTSVAATIYELNGATFGDSIGSDTLYDPAQWYGPVSSGTRGLCQKQGGKYYAKQSGCGPEEYL